MFSLRFLLLFVTVFSSIANAQLLDSSQLKETSVVIKGKTHRVFCYEKTPGSVKPRDSKFLFSSFASQIKKLKSSRKKKDKSKVSSLQSLLNSSKKECGKIPGSTPTPIPNATQIPVTPTPTQVPVVNNFDAQGNVTEKGKAAFQIPSNLSANISLGKIIYNRYCTGCHLEKTGISFPYARAIIKTSPMLYDESQIPNSELAQLIAYLNRFRA